MKVLEDFQMGHENFEVKVGWVTSFFWEKIIFPSSPVPGINNDPSLRENNTKIPLKLHFSSFKRNELTYALSIMWWKYDCWLLPFAIFPSENENFITMYDISQKQENTKF